MARQTISKKRIQIDKARANVVLFVAVASFIATFSLVSSKALLQKRGFESRVIGEKEKTLKTLKDNNQAAQQLTTSYKAFNDTPDNLLGGNPSGTGDKDGENAKLILDALPSQYDFPALTSSIEKMIKSQQGSIEAISGTDDTVAQSSVTDSSKPIEIPFQIDATSGDDGIQNILKTFNRSIRPMTITKVTLSVESQGSLRASIFAKSYYQPAKVLQITTKEVR